MRWRIRGTCGYCGARVSTVARLVGCRICDRCLVGERPAMASRAAQGWSLPNVVPGLNRVDQSTVADRHSDETGHGEVA